jgi:hypothetical protein
MTFGYGIVGQEKERAMTENGVRQRQWIVAHGDGPSSLVPMLVAGLVLVVVGMIAVAALV